MNVEWIAVVISLAGMLGSLVAAAWALAERKRAHAAADRAEEREEDALTKWSSIADSLERMSAEPDVDFQIAYFRGDTFRLLSMGSGTATGVTIEPVDGAVMRDLPNGVTLEKGKAHDFLAMGVRQVRIICDQLPDGQWRPLPPKPPRMRR